MSYQHTNSQGKTFTLHYKDITLRGGRVERIYIFINQENTPKTYATPCDLPDGYSVRENPRNGFLTVRRDV